MSTTPQDAKKNPQFADHLVEFIQKRRVALIAVVAVLFLGLAITGGVYYFMDSSAKKAISTVEALASQYDEIRAITDDAIKAEKNGTLLESLKKASQGKGFASARAFSLIAKIHADKKDWAEAEKNWIDASKSDPKSYLAPVSLYNAAAAAEEQGNNKKAVELYAQCAEEYKESFPLAPRALFAVGRINEGLKDFASANTAYKKIIDQWPNDSWTKLAHSRILSIAAVNGAK